ncbi:unnamed protein product [Mytilus coruscus]|uniref:Caspase family p20 domain-containing protein n=1 Tax=Mytilus coruscus TaxID=42192 RepID=A0A6J8EDT8_MYTCO|nr:unnamed protein product [Mytilus coruscus]
MDKECAYNFSHEKRGIALLIHNEEYGPESGFKNRPGDNEDFIHMLEIFKELELIQAEYSDFDILAFSETWLNNNHTDESIKILNYQNPFRRDRGPHKAGGGIIVYVKNYIHVQRRTDIESANLEAIWLELKFKDKKALLGTFYIPPNSGSDIWEKIEYSLDMASNDNTINYIMATTQMKDEPTHFTESSSSLLDLFITNDVHIITYCGVGPPLLEQIRFHCPIISLLNFPKCRQKTFKRKIWLYDRGDYDRYPNILSEKNWDSVINSNNVEQFTTEITNTIIEAAEKCIPNKIITLNIDDSSDMLPEELHNISDDISYIELTVTEVEDILKIVNPTKASGPYLINPKLLKEASSVLKYPLCKLFNLSLISEMKDMHKKSDCFVCVITAHGEEIQKAEGKFCFKEHVIFGTDGNMIKTREIVEMFDENNCEELVDKPKFFFIQACRTSKDSRFRMDKGRGVLITERRPELVETVDGVLNMHIDVRETESADIKHVTRIENEQSVISEAKPLDNLDTKHMSGEIYPNTRQLVHQIIDIECPANTMLMFASLSSKYSESLKLCY